MTDPIYVPGEDRSLSQPYPVFDKYKLITMTGDDEICAVVDTTDHTMTIVTDLPAFEELLVREAAFEQGLIDNPDHVGNWEDLPEELRAFITDFNGLPAELYVQGTDFVDVTIGNDGFAVRRGIPDEQRPPGLANITENLIAGRRVFHQD